MKSFVSWQNSATATPQPQKEDTKIGRKTTIRSNQRVNQYNRYLGLSLGPVVKIRPCTPNPDSDNVVNYPDGANQELNRPSFGLWENKQLTSNFNGQEFDWGCWEARDNWNRSFNVCVLTMFNDTTGDLDYGAKLDGPTLDRQTTIDFSGATTPTTSNAAVVITQFGNNFTDEASFSFFYYNNTEFDGAFYSYAKNYYDYGMWNVSTSDLSSVTELWGPGRSGLADEGESYVTTNETIPDATNENSQAAYYKQELQNLPTTEYLTIPYVKFNYQRQVDASRIV